MHIQIFKKSSIYHFKKKSFYHCCHDRSSYNLHILYFVIIWLHIVHISQETRIFHVSFIFHYDNFISFQQMIYQCYHYQRYYIFQWIIQLFKSFGHKYFTVQFYRFLVKRVLLMVDVVLMTSYFSLLMENLVAAEAPDIH